MSLTVQAAPPSHFGWLVERVGCNVSGAFRAIEAVDASGRVRGMVGYDAWTKSSVLAHMAADTPMAWRALLRPAFSYPFEEAGRRVLWGLIRADNAASLRLAKRFGFTEAHRIRDGAEEGVDFVLVEMRKADCRWLSPAKKGAA